MDSSYYNAYLSPTGRVSTSYSTRIVGCFIKFYNRMNRYSDYTDTELVAALREGDHAAFEAIYNRYAAKLFHHIQRNLPSRADAEEILHDVFEALWKNHQTLAIRSLAPYLFTMVRHKIIRHFEHAKVKRKYEQHFILFEAAFDFLYEAEEDPSIDPVSFRLLIDTGLSQLPERCQTAFKLRLMENLSNAEIARRMNITKNTVQNYMTRALAALRALPIRD